MLQVVRAARVWDGVAAEPLHDAVVVIEGDRVQRVAPWDGFVPPEQAVVRHLADHTVLPGMIDCHVHIARLTRQILTEGKMGLLAAFAARRALRAGLTTVRDLGSAYQAVFALKDALAAGMTDGSRLLVAGAGICMTGGHGSNQLAMAADGPDACRRVAREQIRQGADVIKIMGSGGAGTPREKPTESQLTREEMRAAVEEAHKAGLPATAHAIPPQAIVDAVEAGVQSIEHGTLLDERAIEVMLRRDVILVPTLSVYDRMASHGPQGGLDGYAVDKARQLEPALLSSFALAHQAGVRIALGTDAGAPYHPPGDVARELLLMQQGGMTALETLIAATRTAAVTVNRGADLGTLEPGKLADLVAVLGDPFQDLEVMAAPTLVFKAGQPFDGMPLEPNQDLALIAAMVNPR